MSKAFIHPLADVSTDRIGEGTRVWQFVVIQSGAEIGQHCNINCHAFIEKNVRVGDWVTVKSGVYLWSGLRVHDHVFIGPNVSFTNDPYPRSGKYPETFQETTLEKGCSIGAGTIILGGVTIGAYAMVGAGSLVTKDVPAFALVMGSPSRICGWVDESGKKRELP
jgi:UDP-2-acetamido-3-amino-2,3-dideoxy-glucuronate N-acetyltransferase